MIKTLKAMMVFALMLIVGNAYAASLQDLQVQDLAKIPVSKYVAYNGATSLDITYTGASTQCAVAFDGYTFTTAVPIGTTDLSVSLAAAAYDTMGELCDYINAQTNYKCKLIGAKRDDASLLLANVSAAVATDAKANGGYNIGFSTGGVSTIQYINRLGIVPMDGHKVVLKYCTGQNDGTGTVKIYGKLAKYASATDGVVRNDTTLVWNQADVDDTAIIVGNQYNGNWMEFAKDEHVVISLGNATTQQTATSSVSCFWDEK